MPTEDYKFIRHLQTLTNGEARIEALNLYKSDSFALNGSLKAGIPKINTVELLEAIRAKCRTGITVYRMASDNEFICQGINFILKQKIVYPAFLSSSRDISATSRFIPANGIPISLTIKLPPLFPIALMEGNPGHGAFEQEILIPAGSVFSIEGKPALLESHEAISAVIGGFHKPIQQLYNLTLIGKRPHSVFEEIDADEFYLFDDSVGVDREMCMQITNLFGS